MGSEDKGNRRRKLIEGKKNKKTKRKTEGEKPDDGVAVVQRKKGEGKGEVLRSWVPL